MILDNMEIGHNVLHGQWNWMRDPTIHSTTWDWDWDHVSPTSGGSGPTTSSTTPSPTSLGQDDDLGYGIMRVDEDQAWKPRYLAQPLWNLVNASIFEYGIASYDLGLGESVRSRDGLSSE